MNGTWCSLKIFLSVWTKGLTRSYKLNESRIQWAEPLLWPPVPIVTSCGSCVGTFHFSGPLISRNSLHFFFSLINFKGMVLGKSRRSLIAICNNLLKCGGLC